jgi:hypothetical protein
VRSVQELALTVREPATADRASDFRVATIAFDEYVFDAARDTRTDPDGVDVIVRLTPDQIEKVNDLLDKWMASRRSLVNAVRGELGTEMFPELAVEDPVPDRPHGSPTNEGVGPAEYR